MLTVIFCTGCVILLSLNRDVCGQTIILDQFNKSLTQSSCPAPGTIIAGERIVLTARLNTSNTDQSNWPLTEILLKTYAYATGWVPICQINITDHDCYGYRADVCGYCERREGNSVYHLVFNVTSVLTNYWFLVTWMGTSSNVSSSDIYVYIIGDPYATTEVFIEKQYQAQDITREALVPFPDSSYEVRTYFSNAQPANNCTWCFASQPLNRTNCYSTIDYDLSDWGDHIDDQVNTHFEDTCERTWSLAIPVTYLPELDCDLPTVTRSNSTGTQVVLTCSFPSFQQLDRVDCRLYDQFYYNIIGNFTKSSSSITCVASLGAAPVNASRRTSLSLYSWFTLHSQFTNGTGQTPRVVRFQVNGSSSVTVNPGSKVTLECKVYGNPPATAVVVAMAAGRVQEHRATSDLLQLTLTQVRCSDTGRYACLGVSSFGTTSSERRGYVDVNVRCPVQIESYVPNAKDQRFNFDPESDVLVTFKVYGYPAPADFSLRLQQGTSWVNVSREVYSCTYVSLNPSRGLVNLLMSRAQATSNQDYQLTMSNGVPGNQDFRFQLVAESSDSQSAGQPSPWLYAFIAVTCVLFVVVVAIIIVIIIYLRQKRQQPSTPAHTSRTERDPGLTRQPGPGARKPEDYDQPGPRDTPHSTNEMYQQPTSSIPVSAPGFRESADEVYVNQDLGNIYELEDLN